MSEVDVRIARAARGEDFQACVELQRKVWAAPQPPGLVGPELLVVANRYGGSVLVATDRAGAVVGFSVALLCEEPPGGPRFWWSHATAVQPDRQGAEIGFRLKVAQRADALDHSIREIRWAFDPFETVNAHLSLRKLGGLVRGMDTGFNLCSEDTPDDGPAAGRLLVEWRLDSSRVIDRLGGEAGLILRDLDGMVRIFGTTENGPAAPELNLEESLLVLEIPADITTVRKASPRSAGLWREGVRTASEHYFGRGYEITDFMLVKGPRRQALYVLEKPPEVSTGRE